MSLIRNSFERKRNDKIANFVSENFSCSVKKQTTIRSGFERRSARKLSSAFRQHIYGRAHFERKKVVERT